MSQRKPEEQPVHVALVPELPPPSVVDARVVKHVRENTPLAGIGRRRILPWLVWASLLGAVILVVCAYANAAIDLQGQGHYNLFWAGVLLFVAPSWVRLCETEVSRGERLAIIAAVGFFNYLPKFLRTPNAPLFHDELAHWRQAEMIFQTGHLFIPVPTVYMSQFFPGLESVTVYLRMLSGLSTWQIAALLMLIVHGFTLVGIFVVAERFFRSARAAAIAAFLYALNPGFMYFDSQYSYESLALLFVVWIIVAVIQIQHARGDGTRRFAWFATGCVLAAACVVTHHLSSYATVFILWTITVVSWIRVARGTEMARIARLITLFTALMTAMATAWLFLVAPGILDYIGAPLHNGIQQLEQILKQQKSAHKLFAQSTSPVYEHLASFGAVAFVTATAFIGVLWLRRARPGSSVGVALILFGLLYFPSLPLIFTESGSEGSRRSWTFSYIGLALLITPVLISLLNGARSRPATVRRLVIGATVIMIAAMQVGNVTMSVDELYRFPGPYVYGSDTRSTTADVIAASDWFRSILGTNNKVITDRYTGEQFSGTGLQWTSQAGGNLPVWELFFQTTPPSTHLLNLLQRLGYQYIVVDERSSRFLPYMGAYYAREEPGNGQRVKPLQVAAIDKFEHLPWAMKIYENNDLSIYRLNYSARNVVWTLAPRTPVAAPMKDARP